jgi:hypothetical protein
VSAGRPYYISPAMLAAYVDLKAGPLVRQRHRFVGASGRRHHSNAVFGLVQRHLARVDSRTDRQAEASLTHLGHTLSPPADVAT